MITKFADIGRRPFVRTTRIERAVAVARSIDGNQSHAFASRGVRDGREVAVRTRRAMKRDDSRAIACAELAPREVATVRKLEHLEVTHRAKTARSGARRSSTSRQIGAWRYVAELAGVAVSGSTWDSHSRRWSRSAS